MKEYREVGGIATGMILTNYVGCWWLVVRIVGVLSAVTSVEVTA